MSPRSALLWLAAVVNCPAVASSLAHRHGIRVARPALAARGASPQGLQMAGKSPLAAKSDPAPSVSAPDDFQPPEPKPLTVPEGQLLATLTGTLALALRLASGVFVLGWTPSFGADEGQYSLFGFRDTSSVLGRCNRPAKPLVLYEYEPSPYCRKVREACGMLDLNVTMLPCPGARQGFAEELGRLGGRQMVPCLVDPNGAGMPMYESDDIIDYLFDTYGPGKDQVPGILRGQFAFWTTAMAALARGLAGNSRDSKARPDNEKMQPLELWGYEGSPFVRPVRERLVELTLPHTMVYCARGSAHRDLMIAAKGRFQVPYLVDPNTGVDLFESDAIVSYLNSVYTLA